MTFPNYIHKYDSPSVFNPADSETYRSKFQRNFGEDPPDAAILCYDRRLVKYITENYSATCLDAWYGSNMYLIDYKSKRLGMVSNFGFGAPIAVSIMEQLIGLGVKRFLNTGIAGTLQKNVDIGDIVVCDKAIRDEGTSWHYIKPDKYASASPEMTKLLIKTLDAHGFSYHVGASWTIDAPYRETVDEVKQYQSEGILTVDMEASALFSLGQYRNVEIGSLFTISDSLADLDWTPAFHAEKLETSLYKIFDISLEVLSA